jgi:hypothetical protein
MALAAIINGTEGRPKCHNRQKIARDFGQAAQIIKYQALWRSCSSLPFTRGSAAAGSEVVAFSYWARLPRRISNVSDLKAPTRGHARRTRRLARPGAAGRPAQVGARAQFLLVAMAALDGVSYRAAWPCARLLIPPAECPPSSVLVPRALPPLALSRALRSIRSRCLTNDPMSSKTPASRAMRIAMMKPSLSMRSREPAKTATSITTATSSRLPVTVMGRSVSMSPFP